MKFLFVAYCISSSTGDSLIGVYKRTLRIGLELVRRGHQVAIACPGREAYRDDLVDKAQEAMTFVDLPLSVLFEEDVAKKRQAYRTAFADHGVDAVVVGEAPLAGGLLDATLAAVEARLPVVVLDNAYSPFLADSFIADHGPICDALLLTGPSSFHSPTPPPHVCQVAPFVTRQLGAAATILSPLDLGNAPLVTVLGYESKAELLAISLMTQLPEPLPHFVFLTRDAPATAERLAALDPTLAARAHLVAPPPEVVLFDLLAASQLTIGKLGFMQVTESLALRTPFIGVYYRGCFAPEALPEVARGFVHATTACEADAGTLAIAKKFLSLEESELAPVHEQDFDAIQRAAGFLEALPLRTRQVSSRELQANGYDDELVQSMVRACAPADAPIQIEDVRCSRIRRSETSLLDCLVGNFRVGQQQRSVSLWGRFFVDDEAFAAGLSEAKQAHPTRDVVFHSKERRFFAEHDRGEKLLPPLH